MFIRKKNIPTIIQSQKPFILYLRRFSRDSYTDLPAEIKHQVVTETQIVSPLKQYINVYTIGKPREKASARGAERLYVSDDEWQKTVHDLIHYAKAIVILLNNSKNCIWEITNTLPYKEKTFIIADDLMVYNTARAELKDKI